MCVVWMGRLVQTGKGEGQVRGSRFVKDSVQRGGPYHTEEGLEAIVGPNLADPQVSHDLSSSVTTLS